LTVTSEDEWKLCGMELGSGSLDYTGEVEWGNLCLTTSRPGPCISPTAASACKCKWQQGPDQSDHAPYSLYRLLSSRRLPLMLFPATSFTSPPFPLTSIVTPLQFPNYPWSWEPCPFDSCCSPPARDRNSLP
jgi:hypothetical protein